MGKEKKSSAELVEDRPQKQGKKPGKARSKPQEAPIVEEKPKSGKRKAAGSASRAGAGKKGAKSGESAGARESRGGKLQEGGESAGGEKGLREGGAGKRSGEEKDREIEGAKSLQAGGNREGTGVESEELRDGPFPIFDNPKKIAFLQAYIEMGGHVSKAARAARVDRSTPYNWLAADPAYKEAFERAKEQAADVLEAEVIRRGAHGFDEPVFYQGKVVGQIRKYSDNLLMFMLKGLRPAKFRDNYNPLAVAAGDVKIQIQIPRPGEPGEIVDAEAREIPEK